MKRLGAILSLALIIVLMTASFCFAESFDLINTYPKDGNTNSSVDNFSIKLYFNKAVLNEANELANSKCITVKDAEGKAVPMKLFYSPKEEGMVMALADTSNKDLKISESTQYTVTISADFLSADGEELGETKTITFTTLNQSRNMTINMVMMVVMFGGMFFLSSKAMKKEQAKKSAEEKVNPYKKAKETGKSVEEVVAAEQKKKARKAAAQARRTPKDASKGANEGDDYEDDDTVSDNPRAKRVKAPRPVSAGGSSYVTGRKAAAEAAAVAAKQKGTTNPKKKPANKSKKKK